MTIKNRITAAAIALTIVIGFLLSACIFQFVIQPNVNSIVHSTVETTPNQLAQITLQQQGTAAEILRDELANSLQNLDFKAVHTTHQLALESDNISEVATFNSAGIAIVSSAENIVEGEAHPLSHDEWESVQSGRTVDIIQDRMLYTITPVILEEVFLGAVLIGVSVDSLHQSAELSASIEDSRIVGAYWTVSAVAIVGLCLLSFAFSQHFGGQISNSLKKLTESAHSIGEGNYQVNLDIAKESELLELASAIGEMSDNLRAQNESVQYLAYHDPLTGQCNRLSFQNFVESNLSPSSEDVHGADLILIDLDDFKSINDQYTQEIGDRALQAIAKRIDDTVYRFELEPDNVSSEIHVARTGGDEFSVTITNPWRVDLGRDVANHILTAISESLAVGDQTWRISSSIGTAKFPQDDSSPDGIVNCASVALFHSKLTGKNVVSNYSELNHKDGLNRTKILEDFRKAMSSGNPDLRLNFQPIINLASGHIAGAESLMRWNHPTLGSLSPTQFIPMIENSDLAYETDLWVIRSACRTLKLIQDSGKKDFKLSANISVANLTRDYFPESINEVIAEEGVDPRQLYLEITESYLHRDEERARDNIAKIQSYGIQVWLDDFGTGFSSLSHLRNLSVEGIKIDRMFVSSLGEHVPDRAMVSAMIALAQAFQISIVAEGIESFEQASILQALGCRLGQGFLFAKALQEPQLLEEVGQSRNFFNDGLE